MLIGDIAVGTDSQFDGIAFRLPYCLESVGQVARWNRVTSDQDFTRLLEIDGDSRCVDVPVVFASVCGWQRQIKLIFVPGHVAGDEKENDQQEYDVDHRCHVETEAASGNVAGDTHDGFSLFPAVLAIAAVARETVAIAKTARETCDCGISHCVVTYFLVVALVSGRRGVLVV